MVTLGVTFALIGTFLFKFANSAVIDYEPIKIIVNENFNAQPGQVSSELQTLEPGVLHQGANFYFKPQVNLPESFILSNIEALISFIQQYQNSYSKDPSKFIAEKDRLMEILKPLMYPSSDISKDTPSKTVFEKENNLEIVNPPEFIPPALEEIVAEPHSIPVIITKEPKPVTELLVITEAPVLPPVSFSEIDSLVEEEVKNDGSVILEEQTGAYPVTAKITVRPIQEPIYNYVQTKAMTLELGNIPEAPVLPSLSLSGIPSNVKKEIIKEDPVITEAQKGMFPTISKTVMRPIQESIINYDELKTATSELGPIPDATFLSQNDNSNPEDSIVSYFEPRPIIAEIEVIPEVPVLPTLSANDIKLVEEGMKIKEPIVVDIVSKPAIQEFEEVNPGSPVLSPLVLQDAPFIIKEEVRKKESEILKEPTDVFPIISEIIEKPIQEPIFNYGEPKPFITEFQVIPEAPVLPPLSAKYIKLFERGMKIKEPIVHIETKPGIEEPEVVIPEASTLPPLVLQNVPSIIKEEVEKEETVILKEPTDVFPIISEIAVKPVQEPIFNYVEPKPFIKEFSVIPEAPVLLPLSVNDIKLIEEGMEIEEPIVVDVESKPATQELEIVIPEAPVLPPLVLQDIPSIIKEEVEKEETVILKEPTDVFPIISEVTVKPVQELILNCVEPKPFIPEFQNIPEAPALPPLSVNDIKLIEEGMEIEEPIVVDVESKPATQELEVVIPEAPVLPPLVLQDIPSIIKEEVEKEETVILKEPTDVFPIISEVTVKPVQELILNCVEPKPFIPEFQNIPEAPALPPLSVNDIKLIEDGMEIEEPIVVDVESKPATQVLEVVITEAPMLPPLVLQDVPSIIKEEVEKEETVILKEPTNVFPIISEIAVKPIQEPIFNYVEPKPFIKEFSVIPEAPVLLPLSVNNIKLIEEGMEIEEPIVVDVESKPATQELEVVIPEAPVLPPLVLQDIPSIIKEEVEKEETVILKEPTDVFPIISEVTVKPVQELILNCVEPKPFIPEFQNIPEAPALPPLSVNDIKLIEEGMEIEEPIVVDVESKPATQELVVVIPEAPVLPPLVLQDIPSIIKEEVEKEETVILKEPTDVFPIISEVTVKPVQELILNCVEPKPFIPEFQNIPEAPALPPLSVNDIKLIEDGMEIEEPIVVDVESKPATQELEVVITEAPMLPPLVLQDVPSIIKEEVEKEETVILKEPTDVFPIISEIAVKPIQEPIFNYVEPKPLIPEFQVIPVAPVLPPLSANDIKLVEEGMEIEEPIVVDVESKPDNQKLEVVIPEAPVLSPLVLQYVSSIIKEEVEKEESVILKEPTDVLPIIPEISARPITEPITLLESMKHFAMENNNSPAVRKVNIEIPMLLEESIEVFPSITERPLGPTVEPVQELEMTNSYVLEVSQPKPEHVVRVKEILPPAIIRKPSNNLRVFSYKPFISNRAAKTKKLTIPRPAPLERFLLMKHPHKLPVMSFPKLSLNAMKSPIRKNKKQFLYPTLYVNDVVEKRIAPNMGFKKYAPPKIVKNYIHS